MVSRLKDGGWSRRHTPTVQPLGLFDIHADKYTCTYLMLSEYIIRILHLWLSTHIFVWYHHLMSSSDEVIMYNLVLSFERAKSQESNRLFLTVYRRKFFHQGKLRVIYSYCNIASVAFNQALTLFWLTKVKVDFVLWARARHSRARNRMANTGG
jgi:hypothetical protein